MFFRKELEILICPNKLIIHDFSLDIFGDCRHFVVFFVVAFLDDTSGAFVW